MNDSDNSHYRTHQQSHASRMGGSTEGLSPPSPHTMKPAATTHPPIGGVGGHQGTMAPGGHGSPACVGLQDPGPAGSPPGPPGPAGCPSGSPGPAGSPPGPLAPPSSAPPWTSITLRTDAVFSVSSQHLERLMTKLGLVFCWLSLLHPRDRTCARKPRPGPSPRKTRLAPSTTDGWPASRATCWAPGCRPACRSTRPGRPPSPAPPSGHPGNPFWRGISSR